MRAALTIRTSGKLAPNPCTDSNRCQDHMQRTWDFVGWQVSMRRVIL